MRIKYWAEYEPLGENCKFRDLPNRLDDTKIENQVTYQEMEIHKKGNKEKFMLYGSVTTYQRNLGTKIT